MQTKRRLYVDVSEYRSTRYPHPADTARQDGQTGDGDDNVCSSKSVGSVQTPVTAAQKHVEDIQELTDLRFYGEDDDDRDEAMRSSTPAMDRYRYANNSQTDMEMEMVAGGTIDDRKI